MNILIEIEKFETLEGEREKGIRVLERWWGGRRGREVEGEEVES